VQQVRLPGAGFGQIGSRAEFFCPDDCLRRLQSALRRGDAAPGAGRIEWNEVIIWVERLETFSSTAQVRAAKFSIGVESFAVQRSTTVQMAAF
jgi:hypothetical protein